MENKNNIKLLNKINTILQNNYENRIYLFKVE